MIFNVLDIIRGTTVDGPGFRTSIYLAGCRHQCKGCHNPQSWDVENGKPMSLDEILKIVEEEDFDVTLSGGDPLFNLETTNALIEALKRDNRNVWLYTGFTWEEIINDKRLWDIVSKVDVVVDGPFVEELRNPDLQFRGSSNQRMIDIKASIATDTLVLWR